MSLVCYLDDSGNDDEPIVTLGGYVSPAQDWLQFEIASRKLFDACELPYLHTMDLHHRKGEFKGWTREQTVEFANGFCVILDQHAYAGFEFSVLKSTFEANKPVYDVECQSSPIGFCLHGIVHQLVNDEGLNEAASRSWRHRVGSSPRCRGCRWRLSPPFPIASNGERAP